MSTLPASPQRHSRLLIAGLTIAGVAIAAAVWNSLHGVRPITELPGTRYVEPRDWPEVALGQKLKRGSVLLPAPVEGSAYRSRKTAKTEGIAGPEACVLCHSQTVDSFLATAHARTAMIPSNDSILGPLTPPHNRLETSIPGFEYRMSGSDSRFVVDLDVTQGATHYQCERSIDFVVGSGNHGQSYLYWEGDRLFQLPVGYYTEFQRWTNAPGYPEGTADFARPVTTRCLDCHNTWFAHSPGSVNRYDKSQAILGVTCVRCHGSATKHIAWHEEHPDDPQPHDIVNPAHLTRDQANEICAQCHSGAGDLHGRAFTYQPGQPLAAYVELSLDVADEQNDDPHSANQLARLLRSRCFQSSDDLRCSTCHDLHRQERGESVTFSHRCRQCHQATACDARAEFGAAIDDRCIECHMPSRRDQQMTGARAGDVLLPLLRDHLIGKWPDVSQRVMEEIRSLKTQGSGETSAQP